MAAASGRTWLVSHHRCCLDEHRADAAAAAEVKVAPQLLYGDENTNVRRQRRLPSRSRNISRGGICKNFSGSE